MLALMAISRAERRAQRRDRVVACFEESLVDVVLDLLETVEFGWHDCYGDISPPENIIDDLLTVSHGDLPQLVRAARLALTDWRDVTLWAQDEWADSSQAR